jgi:hypothetical protein
MMVIIRKYMLVNFEKKVNRNTGKKVRMVYFWNLITFGGILEMVSGSERVQVRSELELSVGAWELGYSLSTNFL